LFYTVYKVTNTTNEKIYIGVHKTLNLDDGYMGSGVHLKRAQEKYGIENFKKEILEVFENPEDMFQMESVLVNEEFVQSSETYNLKIGGEGGWDHINSDEEFRKAKNQKAMINANANGASIKGKEALKILRESPEWCKDVVNKRKETVQKLYPDGIKSFEGKEHTEEAKQQIGAKNSIHQTGEGNSQFGTIWIYNFDLKESKKIKKEQFPEYESLGWLKGRKMKFYKN
jgi:hypothetical protein